MSTNSSHGENVWPLVVSRRFLGLGLLTGLLLLAGFLMPSTAQAKKLALMIGNSSYGSGAQLRNPVNDVKLIAKDLDLLGFDVTVLMNRSSDEMFLDVQTFIESVRPGDLVVVYYAGHGLDFQGKNFLVPVDLDVVNVSGLQLQRDGMAFSWLEAQLQQAGASLSVFFIDACRILPATYQSVAQGNSGQKAFHATLYFYSTLPGALAFDGKYNHSPFAWALHQYLTKEDMDLMDVVRNTARSVRLETADTQIPYWKSVLLDDVYLARSFPVVQDPGLVALRQGQKSLNGTNGLTSRFVSGYEYWSDAQDQLGQYVLEQVAQLDVQRLNALVARVDRAESLAQVILGVYLGRNTPKSGGLEQANPVCLAQLNARAKKWICSNQTTLHAVTLLSRSSLGGSVLAMQELSLLVEKADTDLVPWQLQNTLLQSTVQRLKDGTEPLQEVIEDPSFTRLLEQLSALSG